MEYGKNKEYLGDVIGTAIRTIENQNEQDKHEQSTETNAKQHQFFALLDQLANTIFAGIACQADKNERTFYLTTLPDFRGKCDQIFAKGFGDFPSEMVNRWLYVHDLKHLFHCNGNTIVW
jgi:hypothetical protein